MIRSNKIILRHHLSIKKQERDSRFLLFVFFQKKRLAQGQPLFPLEDD